MKKFKTQQEVADSLLETLGNATQMLFAAQQKGLLSDKVQDVLKYNIPHLQKYIPSPLHGTITVTGRDGSSITATSVRVQPLVSEHDVQQAIGRKLEFGDEVELTIAAKNHYYKNGTLRLMK